MKEGKKNGSMPNGRLAMKGVDQGDMRPMVEDIEKPEKDFAERGFNKTLDYVERQNKFQGKMAKDINKQAYNGRYS
jgi:hypothetical protein